ncbi:hypothetical protein GIB67_005017 [Kingdonia uniflora]|uniref:Uncharacterized protein n=1 Tax=Kingdonia uniflora TaxID=39325 RepID=A0A7J7NMQ2_9MAGN|nr:hypothetical protein GIB67_005017 [Kingdonia uniflora]
MWDRTIRNWDGSLNSQEVCKEASLVNKSWADMVEEVDSSIKVHEEEGESEGSSESESHGSEFSYNIGNGELWRDLAVIGASNLPWIAVGNVNVVLRAGEKKGGRGVRWRAVEELQDFVNGSCLLELSWNFLNLTDGWSEFIRAKFISKSGNFSRITKGSSIWAGARGAIKDVHAHSGWVIGDGASIDLWRDNWCSCLSLKDWINDDHILWNDLHAKLSSIIVEGRWAIPGNL